MFNSCLSWCFLCWVFEFMYLASQYFKADSESSFLSKHIIHPVVVVFMFVIFFWFYVGVCVGAWEWAMAAFFPFFSFFFCVIQPRNETKSHILFYCNCTVFLHVLIFKVPPSALCKSLLTARFIHSSHDHKAVSLFILEVFRFLSLFCFFVFCLVHRSHKSCKAWTFVCLWLGYFVCLFISCFSWDLFLFSFFFFFF